MLTRNYVNVGDESWSSAMGKGASVDYDITIDTRNLDPSTKSACSSHHITQGANCQWEVVTLREQTPTSSVTYETHFSPLINAIKFGGKHCRQMAELRYT